MNTYVIQELSLSGTKMQKQIATKLSSLSLSGFLSTVQKNIDVDNAKSIKRFVQKGMFEEMWQRARRSNDVTKDNIYSTVGLMAAHLFNDDRRGPTAKFRKELIAKPRTGLIRSRAEIHDDIRFILTMVGDELCLLLDNAAMDSRMATVMTYDALTTSFVSNENSLIDFVLTNDVRM